MFDARSRRLIAGPMSVLAQALDRTWITPDRITLTGLAVGLGSAAAAAAQWWIFALALWLLSRLADGVDGALARRRADAGGGETTRSGAGGFLDITCDFVVYGASVVGVAVGVTAGEGAPWWPFALVLLTYYVNGAAFLAFSSIAERTGRQQDDGRSLSFLGGLAEGTETVAVHSIWMVLPGIAWQVAASWAFVVAVSATQRMIGGYRALR